ncbi:serine/arginine repetitive matrix protein 1-like [Schistocerca piceifrons]|uniref:serine/arginine repetitive matrix protein 1-like n=1 Tax=Schistocerca piceifrons TaxID=274613 RepID=UPI001F5EF1E2|nr:serine/arginine repetitive matrix protein 1-like [Schistocerca piceifrons]
MCSCDVIEEARKNLWPKDEKIAGQEGLTKFWSAVTAEIRKNLLDGKATLLKNVGTFSVSKWQIGKNTFESSPAFTLYGRALQKFGVRAEKKWCPKSAPRLMTAATMASASERGLRGADACLGAVQRALDRRLAAGSASLVFPGLGTLLVARGAARMVFTRQFLEEFRRRERENLRRLRPPSPQPKPPPPPQPPEKRPKVEAAPRDKPQQPAFVSCECSDRPPSTHDLKPLGIPKQQLPHSGRPPPDDEAKSERLETRQTESPPPHQKPPSVPASTAGTPRAPETARSQKSSSRLSRRSSGHKPQGPPPVPEEVTEVECVVHLPPPPPPGVDPRLCYVCQLKKLREERAASAPREPPEVTAAKERVINLDIMRVDAGGAIDAMKEADARRSRNIEFALYNKHIGEQRRMDMMEEKQRNLNAPPMSDVLYQRPTSPRENDAYYVEIREMARKKRESDQKQAEKQHKEDCETLRNLIRAAEEARWNEARERKAAMDTQRGDLMVQWAEKRERDSREHKVVDKALPDLMGLPSDEQAFRDRRRQALELADFNRGQKDEKLGRDRSWREDKLAWERRWLDTLEREAQAERRRRAVLQHAAQGGLVCTWRDQAAGKGRRDADERAFLSRPAGFVITDICPRCERCFRRLGYPSESIKK